MPGTATVLPPNAGVIGLIKDILIWINAYTAYLSDKAKEATGRLPVEVDEFSVSTKSRRII
jgi:hypothetical protein